MHKNILVVEWKMLQFTALVCHREISIDFYFFFLGTLSGLKLDIPGVHLALSLRSACQLPGNRIPEDFNPLPTPHVPPIKANRQSAALCDTQICHQETTHHLGVCSWPVAHLKSSIRTLENKETFVWNLKNQKLKHRWLNYFYILCVILKW